MSEDLGLAVFRGDGYALDDGEDSIHVNSRDIYFQERAYNQRLKREKRKKPLPESPGATLDDIAYALEKYQGNIASAAKSLGVTRPVLKRKIENAPKLQRLLVTIRESVIDEAESELFKQAKEGHFPAVSMVLKTIGKDRGYSERVINESELGPNATRTAAGLIEAMRKGYLEAPETKQIEATEEAEWSVVDES